MKLKMAKECSRDSEEKGMKLFTRQALRKGEKLMKQTEKADGEVNNGTTLVQQRNDVHLHVLLKKKIDFFD